MLTIKQARVLWAWVCPITGMVLDEAWGSTKPYTVQKSERCLGKRRTEGGDARAVKVTIELLTDAEQAEHERAYEKWRAKKVADKETGAARAAKGAL